MKITILTENFAGGKFLAEHGLSYLIESHSNTILFDSGHSDVYMKNADKLSLNLQENVDTIVLSHGHWDHGNGLKHIREKKLICHPDVFMKRYRKTDKSFIGIELSKTEIEKRFKLITSKKPYKIAENIIFLGEIPLKNSFEAQSTSFINENGEADFVRDDSAIAIIHNGKLNVITACSHSGICNIIDYAKQVSGIDKIGTIMGGFHLKFNNKQTKQTIEYLKTQNFEHLYPSHCTQLPALAVLHTELNAEQLKTGMSIYL